MVTGFEFISYFCATLERKQGMTERMITNGVPGFDQFTNDIGPLLHVPADAEKSRPHIVLGKNLQKTKGVRIIGAVVKGESQQLRSAMRSGKRPPKPLSSWGHGLITRGGDSGHSSGSESRAEHGGILADCRSSNCRGRIAGRELTN